MSKLINRSDCRAVSGKLFLKPLKYQSHMRTASTYRPGCGFSPQGISSPYDHPALISASCLDSYAEPFSIYFDPETAAPVVYIFQSKVLHARSGGQSIAGYDRAQPRLALITPPLHGLQRHTMDWLRSLHSIDARLAATTEQELGFTRYTATRIRSPRQ